MIVSGLIIYPIKGLKGIEIPVAKLTSRGFAGDRRWMLTDEQGNFLSQRSHPELATYVTELTNQGEILIKKGSNSLTISINDVTDSKITASMWEHDFDVHVAADRICKWWSAQLGMKVLMVHMKEEDIRIKKYIGDGDRTEVSMADGYPYLIIGTASIDELNEKLLHPITFDRFRPNIIVDTSNPHVEDTWKYITIGAQQLYIVKPCARCQVISIDQDTGLQGKEPLKTLATYRKANNKVNFGANTISLTKGEIRVGDKVTVI